MVSGSSAGTTCSKFESNACVCNDPDPCPLIEPLGEVKDVVIYKTGEGSKDRLTRYEAKFEAVQEHAQLLEPLEETLTESVYTVTLDASMEYQSILGFGGALTDASAINFQKMSETAQKQFIELYYGENGIQYTLGRVPIASCDFSASVYSYAETENDYDLADFSIDVDSTDVTGQKLPFIQRVLAESSREVALFASIWAPPAWMTQSGKTTGNPKLRDEEQVKKSYALYFRKFFEAYEEKGVNFWGVTAQNEPRGNTGTWQDLVFSAQEQADFVKSYMGPQLRDYDSELKIMTFDDQRASLPAWADTVMGDESSAQYFDGIAVHWYTSVEDRIVDVTRPFHKMQETHDKYPQKFILATEACTGYLPWDNKPNIGDMRRGEVYGYDILNDLRSWAIGWTDWNLVLDQEGGPNWANNFVDAPIILEDEDKFYLQPMFFYLGHFSKFLPKGSVRIGDEVNGNLGPQSVAFKTPDGLIVTIVQNYSIFEHTYRIVYGDKQVQETMEPHSIHTVIFKAE